MKQLLFLISFLSISFSCNHPIDLKGHWHLFPIDRSNSLFMDGDYEILEILNDSIATFGYYFYGNYGIQGTYINNFIEQEFRFGGECMFLQFDFDLKKDTLYLHQMEYTDNYIAHYKAYKCEEGCCNKEKEMFQNLKIDINLPIAIDTTHLIENDYYLKQNIMYGFPKEDYSGFGKSAVLNLGDKISMPEDIPIWEEKMKIKANEKNHSKIDIVIYADKKTTFSAMNRTLIKLKEVGYKEVFFALRSKSIYDDFKIWLKPFDLSNLEAVDKSNDFRRVEEWLNTSSITPT